MEYRYRGKLQAITPAYALRLLDEQSALLVRKSDGTQKLIWRGKHGGYRYAVELKRSIPYAEDCAA
jgi:hypothetical protein